MGVDVGGGGDVGVAEPVLNLLEREALLEQQGRDRMAPVMEVDARQGGSAAACGRRPDREIYGAWAASRCQRGWPG